MRSKRVASLLVAAGAGIGDVSQAQGAAVDIIFASDFFSGSALQWVRRNPRAGGATIALAPALVSAVKLSNGGADMTLYLQVPPARNHESDYPHFSALKTFGPSNPSPPVIGDCVIAQGTIALFRGATELSPATITATAGADCGGSPLTPYSTTISDIGINASFQPGPSAEGLESVLVTLNPVQVLHADFESFTIGDGSLFTVFVGSYFYQYFAAQGSHLQIIGVLDQSDLTTPSPATFYQLLPRAASDIVVLP